MLKLSGKVFDLTCSEQLFPAVPELLFGRQLEGNAVYFDVTAYAESKGLSTKLADNFFKAYEVPIAAITDTIQLSETDVCRLNTKGHILIESSLLYLFISFVEPRFLCYILDRMDELFAHGFTVSDDYLLRNAAARIPKELFLQLKDGNDNH